MFSREKAKNTWIGVRRAIEGCARCILNLLWLYKCCDMREKFPLGGSVPEDDHQWSMPTDCHDTNYNTGVG